MILYLYPLGGTLASARHKGGKLQNLCAVLALLTGHRQRTELSLQPCAISKFLISKSCETASGVLPLTARQMSSHPLIPLISHSANLLYTLVIANRSSFERARQGGVKSCLLNLGHSRLLQQIFATAQLALDSSVYTKRIAHYPAEF